MLFQAFLAICLSAVTPQHCDRYTAVDWIVVPEQSVGLAGCQGRALEFAAQTRLVKPGSYPKVWCRPVQIPRGIG